VSLKSDLLKFLKAKGISKLEAIAILGDEIDREQEESWKPKERAVPPKYKKR
jgi:uncharacterized protein YoaH (UPF0181 family)